MKIVSAILFYIYTEYKINLEVFPESGLNIHTFQLEISCLIAEGGF